MRSVSVRRPSHATVIAYLALFVALAGTAVAAKKIQSRDIAKNAVKTNKIADAAVSNRKIANFAVNTSKLADEAVTEDQLAPDSVSGNKIQQSSIGTGKLREGAVETDKIADLAVTNPKLADGAVTGSKVADSSLTLADYARAVVDASPDPPALGSGDCIGLDVTVAGVQAGDMVAVYNVDPASTQVLAAGASAPGSSPGTVAVLFCNAGAGVDAGPTPIKIALLR
jgi:hypothetical protein